jgi:hypothetical protein
MHISTCRIFKIDIVCGWYFSPISQRRVVEQFVIYLDELNCHKRLFRFEILLYCKHLKIGDRKEND